MKPRTLFKKTFFAASILFLTQQTIAGTLLVSHVISSSLSFHDENTLALLQEMPVGKQPHEIALSLDGQYALVSNFGDVNGRFPGETVTVVDIPNQVIEKTITLPKAARPHGFAMLTDSTTLVTAQGLQSLLLLDFKRGDILKTLALPGAGAHMVVVDNHQDFAYIANADSGSVVKVDLKQFHVIKELKVGKEIMGLTLTANGLLLAADRKGDNIAVVNALNFEIIKNIPTQSQPVRIELFNFGQSAVVINSASGSAQIIDLNTLEITKTFNTSAASFSNIPVNLFLKNDQRTAYIAHYSGELSYVDLFEGKVLHRIQSGVTANGMVLIPLQNVKTFNPTDWVFYSGPIEINAPLETVWEISKDINSYERLSQGAITAYIDGEIAIGKTIEFQLYKNDPIGKLIPTSYELVTNVDNDRKVLEWQKKLPDGQYTIRWQFLHKLSETQTSSYIVLYIPGNAGKVTKKLLGDKIDYAFQLLNDGIKNEAESRSKSL